MPKQSDISGVKAGSEELEVVQARKPLRNPAAIDCHEVFEVGGVHWTSLQ